MKKEPVEMTIDKLSDFLVHFGTFNMKHDIAGVEKQFWHKPIITLIDPEPKENTIYFDYTIERIEDKVIHEHHAQVNFKECYVFTNNVTLNICRQSRNFEPKDYNYLIERNYKLPLLDYKNE